MTFTTLIDTATLASLIDAGTVAIVDCRFSLADTAWGRSEYGRQHIPGAVYADLNLDLSGETTGRNGRHPLPEPDAFAATLGRWGIDRGTQVVAYDQDTGAYASRLWWLLRWLGHEACAVLDGGYAKWTAEGRPAIPGVEQRPPRQFVGHVQAGRAADVDEVARAIGTGEWSLVDARAPERFRGETETIDRAAGHIPGARNHFYMRNLQHDGTFLPPAALRDAFEKTIGTSPADEVICYCGSGVTACHNLLAMEHAGLSGARLYPGSWSEWSNDPARPIATKGDD